MKLAKLSVLCTLTKRTKTFENSTLLTVVIHRNLTLKIESK